MAEQQQSDAPATVNEADFSHISRLEQDLVEVQYRALKDEASPEEVEAVAVSLVESYLACVERLPEEKVKERNAGADGVGAEDAEDSAAGDDAGGKGDGRKKTAAARGGAMAVRKPAFRDQGIVWLEKALQVLQARRLFAASRGAAAAAAKVAAAEQAAQQGDGASPGAAAPARTAAPVAGTPDLDKRDELSAVVYNGLANRSRVLEMRHTSLRYLEQLLRLEGKLHGKAHKAAHQAVAQHNELDSVYKEVKASSNDKDEIAAANSDRAAARAAARDAVEYLLARKRALATGHLNAATVLSDLRKHAGSLHHADAAADLLMDTAHVPPTLASVMQNASMPSSQNGQRDVALASPATLTLLTQSLYTAAVQREALRRYDETMKTIDQADAAIGMLIKRAELTDEGTPPELAVGPETAAEGQALKAQVDALREDVAAKQEATNAARAARRGDKHKVALDTGQSSGKKLTAVQRAERAYKAAADSLDAMVSSQAAANKRAKAASGKSATTGKGRGRAAAAARMAKVSSTYGHEMGADGTARAAPAAGATMTHAPSESSLPPFLADGLMAMGNGDGAAPGQEAEAPALEHIAAESLEAYRSALADYDGSTASIIQEPPETWQEFERVFLPPSVQLHFVPLVPEILLSTVGGVGSMEAPSMVYRRGGSVQLPPQRSAGRGGASDSASRGKLSPGYGDTPPSYSSGKGSAGRAGFQVDSASAPPKPSAPVSDARAAPRGQGSTSTRMKAGRYREVKQDEGPASLGSDQDGDASAPGEQPRPIQGQIYMVARETRPSSHYTPMAHG